MLLKTSRKGRRAFSNDNDALVPEMWANETLALLYENMVFGGLVHREFSSSVASFGDTVNTRRPQAFTAERKTDSDNVTIQDAVSTNIPVKLNQWGHTSFMIKDGEESKAFKELIPEYVLPAAQSLARMVDRALYGRIGAFLGNATGGLGLMSTSNARQYILEARGKLNTNNAPMENRNMIVTTNSETTLLNLDLFTQAQQVGDRGEALRKASLGEKLGFDFFMSQNAPSVTAGSATLAATGAINLTAGYPIGTTTFVVDGFSAAIPVNSWIAIEGDMTPLRVISTSGGATPVGITVKGGTRRAVVDGAEIYVTKPATVNGASYDAGYSGRIATTYAATNTIKVGQFVTFGTASPANDATNPVYGVIAVNGTTNIMLDRPLDVAITASDNINIMPDGDVNFGFTKNAIALVSRPLATPKAGAGALSAAMDHDGIGMRVTITYNGEKQGHLVTLDLLFGTAILDLNQGVPLLG